MTIKEVCDKCKTEFEAGMYSYCETCEGVFCADCIWHHDCGDYREDYSQTEVDDDNEN